MYSRIKNTVESLRGKRAGISPSVDAFLQAHGNENITQFTISRTVLNPLLTGAIGVISPSFRRKTQDEKLYHLQVLIRTTKTSLSLEKNARITISHYQKRNGSEDMSVSIPPGLTLRLLLERTKNEMGGRFLTYSARDNNCQDLILYMLKSNNLATPSNILFVKQATQSLFTPELRKISNTITDIAGKADILIQGGQVSDEAINNSMIGHVREFARANDMSFMDALQNPECKYTYEKGLKNK
jgi:hypothetical protein